MRGEFGGEGGNIGVKARREGVNWRCLARGFTSQLLSSSSRADQPKPSQLLSQASRAAQPLPQSTTLMGQPGRSATTPVNFPQVCEIAPFSGAALFGNCQGSVIF